MLSDNAPHLEGEAAAARDYRGGHLQIIASAGSGKTEVVSQRVASLLADGVPPEAVVAFTFTERAATSLKGRIERRVVAEPRLGPSALDRLGTMFIGTIHSYCFRLLQQYVPRYETYDVLDDNRLTAFLTREANDIGLKALTGKLFSSIKVFLTNLAVIENELLAPHQLEDPLRSIYELYLKALSDNRFLTYGRQIAQAVYELEDPNTRARAVEPLRHLIVDEYQDINPAQERLIELLSPSNVHLCVVGDDDQSIFQWRGAAVTNIIHFEDRYPSVKRFTIETNRRSRPTIIEVANDFAPSISGRLEKRMTPHRPPSGVDEVVCWSADTPDDEAQLIAAAIRQAHEERGYRYRDIAILCRGRVALPPILTALDDLGIPVQPGGRTNLFLRPEAAAFGRTLCWLVDMEWREGDFTPTLEAVHLADLLERYQRAFNLDKGQIAATEAYLAAWKTRVEDSSEPANLVRDFYRLLECIGVADWDLTDVIVVNRLGTLARCSQLLADYEAGRRRSRRDPIVRGEQRGATDRGDWYYRWLAIYANNWARGAYEDFDGEDDFSLDAVDLTTVHQSKGLEWPLVFVPSLTDRRFPTSMNGRSQDWRVPTSLFDRLRYEGTEVDERRLFYVAMTRARDVLSLSTFNHLSKVQPTSRFLREVADGGIRNLTTLPLPPEAVSDDGTDEPLEITFSELAAYRACGLAYRFRTLLGFQPPLVPELGYGKAVHHILRELAEFTRRTGRIPTSAEISDLFDDGFYLPAAGKAAHSEMKAQARKLVDRYVNNWKDDLLRVWEIERPFELRLGDLRLIGRADVIVDDAGALQSLAIVDYKTASSEGDQHAFQLQIYTDAGRREGLIVDRAFVHDLRRAERTEVPVGPTDVEAAEGLVDSLAAGLLARSYEALPEAEKCGYCDFSPMCSSSAAR